MVDWEEFYRGFRRPGFIPGYEIQNHLGGGAFGEVYKASKSSIGKSYAVKFLKLEDDSRNEAIERELEQVRLFASIDHPNLVTIEDMGVVSGVPYLIMGYAGEDTLSRHLKARDLDRESALRTFVQVCRGVLALHDRRLAHFDLKPGNIFLKGEVARVGDYGLAKLLTEGRQTLSFGRGTPHYMAPEMLKNRADHRADVYSLGVILYESLTFQLPYEAATGYGMIVRDSDDPPPFPDDFPPSIRPVVARCLRLDPADRYQSVHEILEEMGQTARQGDSVRFRASDLQASRSAAPASVGPAGAPADAPAPESPRSTRSEDLRRAAAELARGAVGVAIGVWDGVRERVSGSTPPPDEHPAAGEPTGSEDPPVASDVISVSTLQDDDRSEEDTPRSRRPAAVAAPAREGFFGGAPIATRLGESSGGTVPVPPSSEGGLMGTVGAAAVLGAEIMGALISGPVMVGIRSTGNFIDRAVRGVPGVLGSLIRLVLLLLFLALLGGVTVFVILAAISLETG